jgi:hypothetical protein
MTESPKPAPPAPPAPPAKPARRSWLDRRTKIALALAAFEGLLLLFGRLSNWIVIAVAIPVVAIYLLSGRDMKPGLGKDILWVVAVAQVLIILAAVVSLLIGTLVLILLGVFLAIALALIWFDDPSHRRG